jgi:hypothetical protein
MGRLRSGARNCLASWTFRAFAEGLKREKPIEVFVVIAAVLGKAAQVAPNADQAVLPQEFDTFSYRQQMGAVQQI